MVEAWKESPDAEAMLLYEFEAPGGVEVSDEIAIRPVWQWLLD